ncbi:MAG TPA: diacylglycerol kinase family lipid kinase [Bacteroides sp.]|nr:diacylglycerol kinase family lipid kinase [Bacteroides sp.]
MEKILFFLNPGAGSGIPPELRSAIGELSDREGMDCPVHELSTDDSPEQIGQLLDDLNPSIAVAAGGDGTVNLVAHSLMNREIKLGIIPLGSANGLAYQLKIPADPMEALHLVTTGNSRKIDMLRVNDRHLCLHMSDLGMNARVIRRYDDADAKGFYGYARQYFRELGMRSKFRYTIRTDDRIRSSKAVMVVLANGSYYGTGASISPEGELDDGWFEVVAIRSYPFWFLLYMFLSLFTRKIGQRSFSRIIRCRKVDITVIPPQELQVDGEPLGPHSQISCKIIPENIQIITGIQDS